MDIQEKYDQIFEANKKWIARNKEHNPQLFQLLAAEQHPDFLYIGCSDSRVHPNQIMGLKPGEVFIHRNIANMVINTDLNVHSVINYAVEHLNVKFIIICGHYECGGVKAAMQHNDYGVLNPWLVGIRDVYHTHKSELDNIADLDGRYRRLVELNVYEQCRNVMKFAEVQKSYYRNGYPRVAGWVFNINDAKLHDLNFDFEGELQKRKQVYDITGRK